MPDETKATCNTCCYWSAFVEMQGAWGKTFTVGHCLKDRGLVADEFGCLDHQRRQDAESAEAPTA